MECPLRYCNPINDKISCYIEPLGCIEQHNIKTRTRHPGCPLTIQPEGLRWIIAKRTENWECPVCKSDFNFIIMNKFYHCPSCGVKLDPPEADND